MKKLDEGIRKKGTNSLMKTFTFQMEYSLALMHIEVFVLPDPLALNSMREQKERQE